MSCSRMKDLYDIWMLSRDHEFKGAGLAQAIAATFLRRKTDLPVERPVGLSKAFAEDPAKLQQWKAFMDSIGVELPSLIEIVD
jgi:hypothetical protein